MTILFDSETRSARWLYGLGVVLLTVAAYQQVWRAGFIWDDDAWTTGIPWLLRDWRGLWTMWSQPIALQQYYPLTGTTFWLDYHIWGFWPLPYHIENIVLHGITAGVFGRLLRQLQVSGFRIAAAIFAIHPVMVESVAWITERKNVLSLLLFLIAALFYGRSFSFWKHESTCKSWMLYLAAFLIFCAALLAKITACSLPAVLLLVCWWKRGRVRWRADVAPLIPFFVVAIVAGLFIGSLERTHVGAQGRDFAFSAAERVLIAGRAFWFYPFKLFYPAYLSFIYPLWQLDTHSITQWLYPITALITLSLIWLGRKQVGRGVVAGVYYYAGTIFPALGILNAYFMKYSFVWDHLNYLSSLGLIALAGVAISRFGTFFARPAISYAVGAICVTILSVLTWRQCQMYRDRETLWRTTIRRNPSAFIAHNNLGTLLFERGQRNEAMNHFKESLRLKADNEIACHNIGFVLIHEGKLDQAITQLQRSLQIAPNYGTAHVNLANAFMTKGQVAEALRHYRTAWELRPNNADLAYRIAWLLATYPDPSLRNGHKAIEFAKQADWLAGHKNPVFLAALAAAFAESGLFSQAIASARSARELAVAQGNQSLVDALATQIDLYEAGIPFRDTTRMKAPSSN